ncbi:MAG: TIGR03960 family B12-binding radical SAM protein [Lachnospiraceae bacterium]|nr:TIGR03960 family B12-binding radical SAM protein [Lachnospiraceae bacterium]
MNGLALSNEILMSVDKPARYIGHEINAVYKDPGGLVRFVMCFPDLYEIGMSHLGIQILYDMLNSFDDVWCERVYSVWTDLHRIMKDEHIPLFALESQDPVKDFDFLGITLQYEMCYTNMLQILDLSGIPFYSSDRGEDDPIVICGGPCAYNPEPLADFTDLVYIGEGETVYRRLIDLYKECKSAGVTRREFIHEAGKLPGIYAPSCYEVSYNDDGTIKSFDPLYDDMPDRIVKEVVCDLSDTYYPVKPIVPYIKATQDRVVLEIQRGCIRGCRFCQAGSVYRPTRERDEKKLEEYARQMIANTGHEEISLSSLSSSDYSHLEQICDFLINEFSSKHINISLPSLRVDAFSLDVMSKVQDVRKSVITFAPEAGSQRMRNVINKGLTREDILKGCREAFIGGWTRVKLYFMLGLPFETEEDMEGIAELSNEIAKLYYDTIPKEERKTKVSIVSSTSFFVPKPFTPFQWASMNTADEFRYKAHVVNEAMRKQLNYKSIKYNWHSADVSVLEGVFARGDRRLAKVLVRAYEKGCLFDAWTETFSFAPWQEAFNETGTDPEFYYNRVRSLDEILPWDFIDTGVTKDFLIREYENAAKGTVTPNCRQKCSGCGAARYKGGVCYES